jgi:hypothetical protein
MVQSAILIALQAGHFGSPTNTKIIKEIKIQLYIFVVVLVRMPLY